MKFKLLDGSQVASKTEIENLLQKVQQGETVNTINDTNEAVYIANILLSNIIKVVPLRLQRGTCAYYTKGDGTKHKFNEQGTRIGIFVANNYYDLTISREQVDDSNRVKIVLDQNVKRQIEKEIINAYKRNNGVEF